MDEERDPLTEAVIGAAIEVHRHLGPGLLETVYQKCFCLELQLRGIDHKSLERLPLSYKGIALEFDFVNGCTDSWKTGH